MFWCFPKQFLINTKIKYIYFLILRIYREAEYVSTRMHQAYVHKYVSNKCGTSSMSHLLLSLPIAKTTYWFLDVLF